MLDKVKNLLGFALQARDGEIGHVEDLILDDATWTIRYMVVDTQNWWPGKLVLISPLWIDKIDWADRKVTVLMTRESVRNAPEYTAEALPTRDYEARLHEHYNRMGYWDEDLAGVKHTY